MAQHKANHTASVCYLDRFADPGTGRVRTELPSKGVVRQGSPESVGYRNLFWGADPAVRTEAERRCGQIETAAAPVLKMLPGAWPLKRGSQEWWALLQFLALHLVRSPGWLADTRHRLEGLIRDYEGRSSPEQAQKTRSIADGPAFMVELLFEHLPKVATIFGHLQWALLKTPGPMLLTSDQPLVAMPFVAPGSTVEVQPGFTNVPANLEFRFAVDPRHALLMLWRDQPDHPEPIVIGHSEAVSLNAAARGQADHEVYSLPGSRPPLIRPIETAPFVRPLGSGLFSDYSFSAAIRSRRYNDARVALDELVESGDRRTIKALDLEAAAA